jgi:hypothetical protein
MEAAARASALSTGSAPRRRGSAALLGWLLAAPALLASAPGCQSSPWKQTLIYGRAPVAVYLEREVQGGQVVPHGYAHPAQVAPEKLRALLGSVRYKKGGWLRRPSFDPVLEERELAALVAPLSEGLSRAGPNERVRFLVGRTAWRSPFTGARGVSAVLFQSDAETLNVAFDLLDEPLSEESGDPRAMVFSVDPVTITGTEPEIDSPRCTLREPRRPGRLYSRWLVAHPRDLAASPPPPAAVPPSGSPRAAAATPPQPPEEESPLVDRELEAIRRRLRVLERLKLDGTITPEEYEKAGRQVLLQSER